jgi:hypothetical protein
MPFDFTGNLESPSYQEFVDFGSLSPQLDFVEVA